MLLFAISDVRTKTSGLQRAFPHPCVRNDDGISDLSRRLGCGLSILFALHCAAVHVVLQKNGVTLCPKLLFIAVPGGALICKPCTQQMPITVSQ